MSDSGEHRVLDLLSKALELEGDKRREYLNRECGADGELRAELEELLAGESAADDGFLEIPAAVEVAGLQSMAEGDEAPTLGLPASLRSQEPPPERLGPYHVLDTLGRGGMGTVYLGEQLRPVRRRVALKVIDALHDRREVERFAIECQALAHLNHPNVAALYEVGATEDDHPFVAMELVEGEAITDWCDRHRLPLRQRLELFFGVCAGVRHAHEKGILHRDLKPSNVLVTEVDGRPTAKVIDFGIARVHDEPLFAMVAPVVGGRAAADEPAFSDVRANARDTAVGGRLVGSPAYMSPEAAAGGRDLDTRADVYSLGLLLYELIVGLLPFDPDEMTLLALLERSARGDLPAPSERFAALEPQRRAEVAERRKLSEKALQRRLRGDLDAILGRAIASDREQRYSSPADLAADLERHLGSWPVAARAPSVPYLLGRTLRRRAGLVAALSALILALTAGIVSSTREARRADQEAQRAREVSRFLVDLFGLADPERAPDEPVDIRQLLDQGAERLRHELVDQPLDRALFLHTICDIYTKMGLSEPAEALALEALQIRQAHLKTNHLDLLASMNQLGLIYRRQRRFGEAEHLLERVLAAREDGGEPLALAQALNNLANLRWYQRRLEEALPLHRRAAEIRERELGKEHRDVAESLNNLGVLYKDLERYEDAEFHLRRADQIFVARLGVEHAVRAAGLNNLGMVEHKLGRWADAEAHLREAAEIWKSTYGDRHHRTLRARYHLAGLFLDMDRDAEGVHLLRDIASAMEDVSDLTLKGAVWNRLGLALGRLGDFAPAEAAIQRGLAVHQGRGGDLAAQLRTRSNLAWLMARQGRLAEAEAEQRRLLVQWQQAEDPESLGLGKALYNLGGVLVDQGRDAEAEPFLRRSLEIYRAAASRGSKHPAFALRLVRLGKLLGRNGKEQEARGLLSRAVDIYRESGRPEDPDLRRATEALADL